MHAEAFDTGYFFVERCVTCAKGRGVYTAVADAEHRCHARDEFVY